MAKILVADDNSNIQKMVALALKDQGIDVVAVGNGEAAVRKISDIRPDLVLADVFMPVRNGYEVCEYVKTDRSLSHIPVILLVGAFDPLDEQEAQRVGADGVLKKPFVPPDPLISMVKSALSRAAAAHPPQAAAEPARTPAAVPPAHEIPVPVFASVPAHSRSPEATSPEAFSSAPRLATIPEGSQPLAFGSLLSPAAPAPPQEAEREQDPNYLVSRNPNLDDSRSWNATHTEETTEQEEEEVDSGSAAWRRDGGNEELEEAIPAGAHRDWRDAEFKTENDTEEAEDAEPLQAAYVSASTEPTPIEKQSSLLQSLWKAIVPPAPVAAEPAPAASAVPEPVVATSSSKESAPEFSVSPAEPLPAPSAEPEPGASPGSWYSVSTSPWDAEVKKVGQLADTWNVGAPSAPAPEVAPEITPPAEARTPGPAPAIPVSEITQSLVAQTLREAQVQPAAKETPAKASAPAGTTAAPALDMDALVKKVLERMSPDMIQNMTRELLKPVVEAIVRGELDLKK